MIRMIPLILAAALSAAPPADTGKKMMGLREFIGLAASSDPRFQKILVEQHYLKYRKDLNLPSSDLVFSLAGQYDLFLNDSSRNGSEGSVSLSKLFPFTGTEIESEYSRSIPSTGYSRSYNTSFTIQVSQPIARNALGRGTRMLERKLEVENSLARYQIVEAYEDYLAVLISLYIDWYTAYENVNTGREIVRDSNLLYSLIVRKRSFRIAHPEDVSKGRLEVLAAREDLVGREEEYGRIYQQISAASGLGEGMRYIPREPENEEDAYKKISAGNVLKEGNRTFMILQLLEKQGILGEEIARDNLLPSASLFAGYSVLGRDYRLTSPEKLFFFGISSDFSIGRQKEKAEAATAALDRKKSAIEKKQRFLDLRSDIRVLAGRIESEENLVIISQEKIRLSRGVVAAEQKNFLIGRADLNDLIEARRQLNRNRYSHLYHRMLLQKLVVEWKRLTDTLVRKKILVK